MGDLLHQQGRNYRGFMENNIMGQEGKGSGKTTPEKFAFALRGHIEDFFSIPTGLRFEHIEWSRAGYLGL
jgi:hypothetical protein